MEYQDFLNRLFADFKFDLQASEKTVDDGFLLDVTGGDSALLHQENGELLDALETILFQAHGKEIGRERRFTVDADGFRQTRRRELQAMARFAADSVRKNGRTFTFGVLNGNERRIIHSALQTETDLISESVGEGKTRRLQIRLK